MIRSGSIPSKSRAGPIAVGSSLLPALAFEESKQLHDPRLIARFAYDSSFCVLWRVYYLRCFVNARF